MHKETCPNDRASPHICNQFQRLGTPGRLVRARSWPHRVSSCSRRRPYAAWEGCSMAASQIAVFSADALSSSHVQSINFGARADQRVSILVQPVRFPSRRSGLPYAQVTPKPVVAGCRSSAGPGLLPSNQRSMARDRSRKRSWPDATTFHSPGDIRRSQYNCSLRAAGLWCWKC